MCGRDCECEKPRGPLHISDATQSIQALCDKAREMLEELQSSVWWQMIVRKKWNAENTK